MSDRTRTQCLTFDQAIIEHSVGSAPGHADATALIHAIF